MAKFLSKNEDSQDRSNGVVAKWSNAAGCKPAGHAPSKVRILPAPPVVNFRLRAGVAQLVEHQPSKLRVAGPSPVSRSIGKGELIDMVRGPRGSVVEHFLGKEGVTGSIPVVGSILVSGL